MKNIENLIEILEDQCNLYDQILEIMEKEKIAITRWKVEETLELAKTKDTLVYKEKLLEEARTLIIRKIAQEYEQEELTLSDIITYCEGTEYQLELMALRDRMVLLTTVMPQTTLALKMLYNTNMNIINEFFTRIGIGGKTVYGSNRVMNVRSASTLNRVG